MQPYLSTRQKLRQEGLRVAAAAVTNARNPFPFPPADHNPFTGASQAEYDTARGQLDQAYETACNVLSQQWQMAVSDYQANQPDNDPPEAA